MEELDIRKLLDKVKDFNLIERIILSHDGTIQTLLSVLINKEVKVNVVHQEVFDDMIVRFVELVTNDDILALAKSVIKTNIDEIKNDILLGKLGLGQILKKYKIFYTREFVGVKKYNEMLVRVYKLNYKTNDKYFNAIITEMILYENLKSLIVG